MLKSLTDDRPASAAASAGGADRNSGKCPEWRALNAEDTTLLRSVYRRMVATTVVPAGLVLAAVVAFELADGSDPDWPVLAAALVALAALGLVAHRIEHRFLRPILDIVGHLRSAGEPCVPPERLRAAWPSWAERLAETLARDRRRASAFERTDAQLRAALDSLPDGLLILDADDRIAFFNARYPQHLMPHIRKLLAQGKRFPDMLEEAHSESPLYHPDMGQGFLERRLALRESPHVEHEQRVIDGRWFRIRESRTPDGGKVLLTTEITGMKEAAAALEASEARFRAVVESQSEFVQRVTPEGRLTFVNEAFCRYMHMNREALLSPDWIDFDVILPECRKRHRAAIESLTPEHPHFSIEMRCINPDGRIHDEAWSLTGIFDSAGRLVELQSVGRDITEMRNAMRALAESEARYRAVIEDQTEIVARFDADMRLVFCNSANARLLGLTPEEATGTPMFAGTEPELAAGLRLTMKALTPANPIHQGENEKLLPDGSRRWFAFTNRALFDADDRCIGYQAVGHDITERRQAEAALAESAQWLRAVVEAHPLPMSIVRRSDDGLIFANRAYLEAFGLDQASVRTVERGSLYADPDDRARMVAALDATGAVDNVELVRRRRDGTTFPAAMTARAITLMGEPALVFSCVDLTERKAAEAEIVRQREALHQSEKLGALGSLLAGVAHELNNPLSIVTGYAGILRDQAADEQTRGRAERIAKAAERCARIVRTFLAMARSEPRERGLFSLEEVIDAALEITAYGLRSAGIAVEREVAADLPLVWGDADQLHQVMSNLIVNAQQAMQETTGRRRLRIGCRAVGDALEVTVADSGPGLPEAVLGRVFDPFFTTKPAGMGTGIGLSVSRGIAQAHGGTLDCRNEAGGGAVFSLRLPTADVATQAATGECRGTTANGLRLLLVDDEADVLAMLAELLARDGHDVVTAGSGREALALIESRSFDVIVSDLRMPDLDGRAFFRLVRERHPDLARRLLFLSGDVLGGRGATAEPDLPVPLIEKPVEIERLREAIAGRMAPAARPPMEELP
jgi:PAS domain S-box-containing protein